MAYHIPICEPLQRSRQTTVIPDCEITLANPSHLYVPIDGHGERLVVNNEAEVLTDSCSHVLFYPEQRCTLGRPMR